MNNILKIIGLVALVLVIGIIYVKYFKQDAPVACTMEVNMCQDGSSVGRTGPLCEFSACPTEQATTTAGIGQKIKSNGVSVTDGTEVSIGTLKGSVTVGPVCPIERPDYPCKPTPEMYAAAQVFVYLTDKATLVKTITPDPNGDFSISLSTGKYYIDMIHQRIGGTTGVPTTVSITKGGTVTLKLNVDTGLR